MFTTDEPIKNKKQDTLRRAGFASKFGDAIANWTNEESLVIGLYGKWGSGKSSIVNLAIDEIKSKRNKDKKESLIINFNPWNFTEQNQLITIFLQELSKSFNYKDPADDAKRIGKELLTYSKFFIPLASLIPGAYPFTQIIEKTFNEVGTASKEWGELKTKSIEEFKKKLDKKIQKLNRKIIIVIDDIDRLNPTEIRQIFQLVKLNANFPNTVYLLSFDEEKVAKALEEPHFSGKEYLEKIIQIPVNVPSIEQDKLEEIFMKELEGVTQPFPQETLDIKRWGNLYYGRLQNFFTSIRQIKRYINSLKFNIQIIPEEVNALDFIGIEAIRLFSPEVYKEIALNKELFTDLGDRYERRWSSGTDERKEALDKIFSKSDEELRKTVKEVVLELFPPIGNVYGRTSYSHDIQQEWHKQKRICAPDRFDSYFLLAVSSKVLPQTEVDALVKSAGDTATLERMMLSLNKRQMAKKFLHRLSEFKDQISTENIESFLLGIFNPSDKYPHEIRGMYDEHIRLALWRTAYHLLKKLDNEEERLVVAKNLIKKSKSLGAIITFVSMEEPNEKDKHEVLFNVENHKTLKTLVIEKIHSFTKRNSLAKVPDLINILYRWKEWETFEEPKKYVHELVKTTKGLAQFISGCAGQRTSHGIEDHVSITKWEVNRKYVDEFSNADLLKSRIEKLKAEDRKNLSTNENMCLDLFLKSFEKNDEW